MSSTLFRYISAGAVLLIAIGAVAIPAAAQPGRAQLAHARESIEAEEYDEAELTLTRLSERARGDVLQEALFLLGGLVLSTENAERAYQRVIDADPTGEWARLAYLELAKVQYALGRYAESYRMLEDSRACNSSEEACLFSGLSALMLERYDEARAPLERIRRGKLRTWAYLSLARADEGQGREDDACKRYEALSSAMISPTALYRHAECLEKWGDSEGALREFREVIDNFQGTPEAVLAAEKLRLIADPPASAGATAPSAGVESLEDAQPPVSGGYTIQFGSFRDRGNAIKLAAKIKRVFPGVRIDMELIRYREYHRVRYGYFQTREIAAKRAEEISKELDEDFTIMSLR